MVAWRKSRAIPLPAKWMATLGMSSSIAIVYFGHAPFWVFLLTLAVILPSAAYVWTRPHSAQEPIAEIEISSVIAD